MAFDKELPEWKAAGIEPPLTKRNEGWKPGEKPPADWLNWTQHRTYEALKELREKAIDSAGGTMTGPLTVPRLISTVATGTAPLTVDSTTQVDNLNAGMVNGYTFNQGVKTTDSPSFAGLAVAGSSVLTGANHGSTGDPHSQYALRSNVNQGVKTTDIPLFVSANVVTSGNDAYVRFVNTGTNGRTYLISSGSGGSGLGVGNFGIWDESSGRRFHITPTGAVYAGQNMLTDGSGNMQLLAVGGYDARLTFNTGTGGAVAATTNIGGVNFFNNGNWASGIYSKGSGKLEFFSGNGSVPRVTIDPDAGLVSLTPGIGERFHLYGYGNAGVRQGFGIDMSGISGRELSIFASTSSSTTFAEGRISFGARADNDAAYMQYAEVRPDGIVLGKPSLNDQDAAQKKTLTFTNGGYGPPGMFNTASNGDKITFYNSVRANYDGRIGIGNASNMWFKSSGSGTVGSFDFYVGATPTKILNIAASGVNAYGHTVLSRGDANWHYGHGTLLLRSDTGNPTTLGFSNAGIGGSITVGYSGFNGFQFYNTVGSYATVALGELQSTNVITPLINSKNIFEETLYVNSVGLAKGLTWNNYGNGHRIVDNSNGGYGGGNINSSTAWTPNYGNLMGYNGSSTYGVKVDRSRVAEGLRTYSGADPAAAVGEMWMRTDL